MVDGCCDASPPKPDAEHDAQRFLNQQAADVKVAPPQVLLERGHWRDFSMVYHAIP